MFYPYRCPECDHQFDIAKPLSAIDLDEPCPECNHICTKDNRIVAGGYFLGEKVEDAVYDPVFGCVIKDSNHRRKLAKERNWEEIGNDDPDKMYDTMEADRNKRLESNYDKIFDTSIEIKD